MSCRLYFQQQQRRLFGNVEGPSVITCKCNIGRGSSNQHPLSLCPLGAEHADFVMLVLLLTYQCNRRWSSTVEIIHIDHTTSSCGHSITCVHVCRTKEGRLTHSRYYSQNVLVHQVYSPLYSTSKYTCFQRRTRSDAGGAPNVRLLMIAFKKLKFKCSTTSTT